MRSKARDVDGVQTGVLRKRKREGHERGRHFGEQGTQGASGRS